MLGDTCVQYRQEVRCTGMLRHKMRLATGRNIRHRYVGESGAFQNRTRSIPAPTIAKTCAPQRVWQETMVRNEIALRSIRITM